MQYLIYALTLLVGVFIGYIISSILKNNSDRKKINSAENMSKRIIEEANIDAETAKKEAILTAKEEIYKLKQNIENEEKK